MLNTLALILFVVPTRADSVEHYYSWGNIEALQALCSTPVSREEDFLCRYRLYPLTLRRDLLSDLPSTLQGGSAREKAILAGLWGYRATTGSIFNMMRCGRRAGHLLSEARGENPDEPFALLIEGQSLLFRPGLFGGDASRALEVFRQLQRVTGRRPDGGVSTLEADLWVWYTLVQLDDPAAAAVRKSIEGRDPPSLYRQFLESPPS